MVVILEETENCEAELPSSEIDRGRRDSADLGLDLSTVRWEIGYETGFLEDKSNLLFPSSFLE